jgi:hypothetical protein
VRVDQRRPELVLQVGAARFAVERSIGRRVVVHAARPVGEAVIEAC